MKTVAEWDQDILNITFKIHQDFPELSKYIKEMPVKFSEEEKTDVNLRNLMDYYNSLVELVGKYSDTYPEDLSKNKAANEKEFKEGESKYELDVPGAELDDKEEKVGREDEENNYYSLGGENHHDLDEN